ncbi:hypothetical protein SAMD00019534_061640 [Acytostelium subglobosum LB1]|uniref:hypothetical protein n=1 Tax=Acytostelium subglobosum LB1 TaxID=1410327 RepID=UPI000644A18E|nr:hypothetical protein SAMD00019534_061640 [Acytostelium subglobosum LB1]GAM22989.1 hypothetical protein SAMD00019534_061640 [Acytostelium subglobosum LB1]|eukprot:XP_012754216.1 hypothetical protein SAMD00019534_061640 [Acytostelium subglobosum LB1]
MKQGLITVKRSDSLDAALKVLSTNDISSCPVIDPKLGCMGLVDMFDIVDYLLSMVLKQSEHTGGKTMGLSFYKLNLDPVSVVINQANDVETMCPVVTESDNVYSLIQLFTIGCHRVPVYASTDAAARGVPRLSRIISQTDLAVWLWQDARIKERIAKCPYLAGNIQNPNPKSVSQSTPTVEVMKLLHENKISSVAVVDDKGKLKNEISTDSWKGMNEKNIDTILDDVKGFLKSKAKREKDGKKRKLFTCSPDTPIQEVWQTIVTNRYHRVWVVSDGNKLVGVISLVDLLKALVMLIGNDINNVRDIGGEQQL